MEDEMRSIPPFKLTPVPMTPEAKALPGFKWASPEVGKRHQLGGEPTLLRPMEEQVCSNGHVMTFYAQLDSINDDIVLADVGLVFVFVCFECFETKSVLQSS
jgi:hypothetical protein